jgi:hypothetical protein
VEVSQKPPGKAYNEHQVQWTALFDQHKSSKAFEEDVGVSSFGLAVVKPEGSPIYMDSERQAFITRYQHVTYGLGFVITREAVDDDQYDVVGPRKAQGLAFSMRQTKEVIAANIYNRAFNTAFTYGDGATLIASAGGGGTANRPLFAGGTWTNGVAVASDLSEAALEQAYIDIGGYTNDRGLLIAVQPKSLIIPRQLKWEAARILNSTGRVGTDLNDTNALKDSGLFSNVVVNHYLIDADAWFIRTNTQHGMKYFERRGESFDMDNDFDTENAKYKATARYSFGMTDPRGIYGSPGA